MPVPGVTLPKDSMEIDPDMTLSFYNWFSHGPKKAHKKNFGLEEAIREFG